MTALALVSLFVLVAVNGFFVAAEFALVRVRREKVEAMVDEGKRGAAMVVRQLDAIDRYLSACQLGITMASIGIGFLGEPAIASLLEEPLGEVVGHGVAVAIAFALAFTIATTFDRLAERGDLFAPLLATGHSLASVLPSLGLR